MNKPVLVLVTTSFPVKNDGSEAAGAFVADLVEELSRHATVRVVAPGLAAERGDWKSGVEIHRYPAPNKPLSNLKVWHPIDLLHIGQVLVAGMRAVRDAVNEDATHVIALWGLPSGEWARRAARQIGIPYSVWMLGSDVWSLGRIPILRAGLRRAIREAECAWADGYQLASDASEIGGIPVKFLPSTRRSPSVSAAVVREQPPWRLLFLGRWHPNKGVDILLAALHLLKADVWARIDEVVIAGGGPMEHEVSTQVASLKAQGRPVRTKGFLSSEEAFSAIAHADWMIIPSRIESIPVVLSDALKAGRPVIATPVGDMGAIVGGQSPCGILARSPTAECVAEAVDQATQLKPSIFRDGIQHNASLFDLTRIARTLLDAVEKKHG